MSTQSFFFIFFITSMVFGTTMGAYFGTMEYRIRADLPLITRDCICPSCSHKLSVFHQIPILSYLALGGKCHYCHSSIPVRYPLTEAGFLLYYVLTYCIFRYRPGVYLCLWYLFMLIILLIKGHAHIPALLRGIAVTTFYHGAISFICLISYAANDML